MVTLTCKTGHRVKVLERNAAKKLRCQECKEPLTPATPEAKEPPSAGPAIKVSVTRCPFCHEGIDASAEKTWVACGSCLARHHKPCWRESKKCASCGDKKPLVVAEKQRSRYAGATGAVADTPRLLSHEAHIRAIAFWDILGGALVGLMALLLLVAAAGSGPPGAGVYGFLFLIVAVASFAGGVALWSYLSWGKWITIAINYLSVVLYVIQAMDSWAPDSAIISAAISALWSGLVSWVLLSKSGATVCSPGYTALVQKDAARRPSWYASPFFWVPWALVILIFVLAFGHALGGGGGYRQPYYSSRGW